MTEWRSFPNAVCLLTPVEFCLDYATQRTSSVHSFVEIPLLLSVNLHRNSLSLQWEVLSVHILWRKSGLWKWIYMDTGPCTELAQYQKKSQSISAYTVRHLSWHCSSHLFNSAIPFGCLSSSEESTEVCHNIYFSFPLTSRLKDTT